MKHEQDVKLPTNLKIKNPEAALQAILNIARDAEVIGLAGDTNLAGVRCVVEGLNLGHWYKLSEALGDDVCKFLEEPGTQVS